MKRRHDLDALVVLEYTTQFCNPFFHVQQVLHGRVSKYDYDFRPDSGNFSKQKWFAHCYLIWNGRPIARRPAAIDVADQDFFTLEANRFNDLRQQLTSSPNKRPGLHVFVSTWSLTNKHQTRFAIAFRVNDVCAPLMERTTSAISDVGPNLFACFRQTWKMLRAVRSESLRQRGSRVFGSCWTSDDEATASVLEVGHSCSSVRLSSTRFRSSSAGRFHSSSRHT